MSFLKKYDQVKVDHNFNNASFTLFVNLGEKTVKYISKHPYSDRKFKYYAPLIEINSEEVGKVGILFHKERKIMSLFLKEKNIFIFRKAGFHINNKTLSKKEMKALLFKYKRIFKEECKKLNVKKYKKKFLKNI